MSLIELEANQFSKVYSLFSSSKHLRFTIDAVIAGNSPSRIWVDTPNEPSIVFLWDGFYCYYLTGTPKNKEFNSALKRLLLENIVPEAISKHRTIFKIEYSPNEWESFIEEILKEKLKEKLPIQMDRKFFALKRRKTTDWETILPKGFKVRKIDKKLLESGLSNVKSIINEITECWYSVDDFLERGFGFCVIYEHECTEQSIQGWCTCEYLSAGKCGIGIETFPPFQNKGLATAMASAFVESALSNNIQPHWDAGASNYASIRVAKKVGFEKIQDYKTFFGSFTNNK